MQLPLAVIPLMCFAQNAELMGKWCVRGVVRAVCWIVTAAIVALNGLVIWQTLA
jgi:manganese transport protein